MKAFFLEVLGHETCSNRPLFYLHTKPIQYRMTWLVAVQIANSFENLF